MKRSHYNFQKANNEDVDQTAQMRRLVCAFFVRIQPFQQSETKPICLATETSSNIEILLVGRVLTLSRKRRKMRRSYCVDVQACRYLCCSHTTRSGVVASGLLYSCLKRPLKNGKTKILVTNGRLMKVEIIAECSILQYF